MWCLAEKKSKSVKFRITENFGGWQAQVSDMLISKSSNQVFMWSYTEVSFRLTCCSVEAFPLWAKSFGSGSDTFEGTVAEGHVNLGKVLQRTLILVAIEMIFYIKLLRWCYNTPSFLFERTMVEWTTFRERCWRSTRVSLFHRQYRSCPHYRMLLIIDGSLSSSSPLSGLCNWRLFVLMSLSWKAGYIFRVQLEM